MKEELLRYLKTKHITTVIGLWGESKTYYAGKQIPMGGGFSSNGDNITVALNINSEMLRFNVKISECQN